MAASWHLPSTHLLVLLLLVCCYFGCSRGETKRELYSLIPSLTRRIDRVRESYSLATIHFFVVAPNPIIVPPHSTPPRRPLRIRAGLWPFLFLILFFFFSYFFSHPPYSFQWNMDLVHLFCSSLSLGYSFNQFKYAATYLTKTVR